MQVAINPKLRSFLGNEAERPHFEKAYESLRVLVQNYSSGDKWLLAYVLFSNSPGSTSVLRFKNCVIFLKKGILEYLSVTASNSLPFHEIDTGVISRYLKWETENCIGKGGSQAFSTVKNRWYIFKRLVRLVADSPGGASLVSPVIQFPLVAFKGMGGSTNTHGFDEEDEFIHLYKAARLAALEILADCRRGWDWIGNPEPYQPLVAYRGMKRYPTRAHTLLACMPHFRSNALVTLGEIQKADPGLFDSIFHYGGGFANVTMSLRPSAKNILPFIILLGIYSQANTGTLRSLKTSNVSSIEVLGRQRYLFHLLKTRGIPYQRSYLDDPSDPLSPGEIVKFITQWTQAIRPLAGKSCDDLFIFYVKSGGIRAFKYASADGTDSDILWDKGLADFCKKWSIPNFTFSDLRMTGLEIVRQVHEDDMRAVQAAGGQSSETVIREHYEGKEAFRRSNVELSEVAATLDRFVMTNGRIDPRGTGANIDPLAATPGWGCVDPFSSPFAGQREGVICSAFGQCPACPLATLDKTSAYTLARALQLREEIEHAQEYLNFTRWTAAFAPVRTALDEKWLPLFTSSAVRKRAAALSLPKIGKLE